MKRIGPKTKPTGFVPPTATKSESPDSKNESSVSVQTTKAWRAKVTYMQERGRWETLKCGKGQLYSPPKSYDGREAITDEDGGILEKAKESVWQRVVVWCEARNINPEEYIRQCFQVIQLNRPMAPEPGQLLGDTFLNKWLESQEERAGEIELKLRIEKEVATRHITVRITTYGDTEEIAQYSVIVAGEAHGLSPLFRFCLAVAGSTKRITKLADALLPEAVLQFETARRLYQQYWKSVLPEDFPDVSERLYPALLEKLWTARKT